MPYPRAEHSYAVRKIRGETCEISCPSSTINIPSVNELEAKMIYVVQYQWPLAFGGDAQQRNNTNRAQNGIDWDCAVVAPGVI